MKRLMVVVGLLAFAAPAFASEAEQWSSLDEQPALMTDAEFDGVVAGGNAYGKSKGGGPLLIIVNSQVALNFAVVYASGSAEVDLTQIAIAIGGVVVAPGSQPLNNT